MSRAKVRRRTRIAFLLDDSLEAIRERADESVIWAPGEASQRVSDELWAAKRDVRTLLDLLEPPAPSEARDE